MFHQGDLSKKFVHMIESTIVVSTKLLCILLETHQRAKEGIAPPTALLPHLLLLPLNEQKLIPFVRAPQEKGTAGKEKKQKKTPTETPSIVFEK
jgi:hypothetical protein